MIQHRHSVYVAGAMLLK